MLGCGGPIAPTAQVTLTPSSPELSQSGVDAETGIWESAPFSGSTWFVYPPRTQVLVPHTLGYLPRDVRVFLSFEPSGRNAAVAAGDLARITEVTPTSVTIWNDTQTNFYARVALR